MCPYRLRSLRNRWNEETNLGGGEILISWLKVGIIVETKQDVYRLTEIGPYFTQKKKKGIDDEKDL